MDISSQFKIKISQTMAYYTTKLVTYKFYGTLHTQTNEQTKYYKL